MQRRIRRQRFAAAILTPPRAGPAGERAGVRQGARRGPRDRVAQLFSPGLSGSLLLAGGFDEPRAEAIVDALTAAVTVHVQEEHAGKRIATKDDIASGPATRQTLRKRVRGGVRSGGSASA